MKFMMFGGGSAVLAGGLYMTGALNGGQVYDMPTHKVYEELLTMKMPEGFGESLQEMPGSDVVTDNEADKSLTWRFTQYGHDMAIYKVELTPVGTDKTRVNASFSVGTDGPDKEQAELINASPFVQAIGKTAMGEQVSATLGHRAYDRQRVGAAIAGYAMTHQSELRDFDAKIQAMADKMEHNIDVSDETDVAQARFGGSGPMVDARPMNEARPMSDAAPMVNASASAEERAYETAHEAGR